MTQRQISQLLMAWTCCVLAVGPGCRVREPAGVAGCADACFTALASEIEYPEVSQCSTADESWAAMPPLTLSDAADVPYWDITLQEVVRIALAESQVIRDLGGAVVRTPNSAATTWDPAIRDTNPRFGVDAALSAFDAEFSTSVFGEKNDRALNNEFFGGGTRLLQQDVLVAQAQLAKRGATGTEYSFRHNIDYDANNAPSNRFPSAWNVNIETEVRHPLLQGSGVEFNRIAGPNDTPGLYNGVLIARVNTDIELTHFELAVRNLVSNIENAYWDLYFAYRDLDAKIAARDASLETWRKINALYQSGRRGGEAEKEAQAREQFFRFQEEVQNALSGRLVDGTQTYNGSPGGTFRATGGVQVTERRLRLLMGIPPSDGRLIRPAEEPVTAPVHMDWTEATQDALVRRVELRRHRFETRRRELEWIASKNYLMPRLDAVGRYRWRGFGHDLLNSESGQPPFDNAYANLTGGDFQEWQLGLELSVPIGFRQAFAAARNAELSLSRSRALLREAEHFVLHDVADAVAELDRALVLMNTTANRLQAAQEQLAAVTAAYEADKAPLDLLLEAQRRLANSESNRYRSLTEYAVALKNIHFSTGTLLSYDGVMLSEGRWRAQAYGDAEELERRRGKPLPLNYASSRAPIVARGSFDQHPLLIQTEPLAIPPQGDSSATPDSHRASPQASSKSLPLVQPASVLVDSPTATDAPSAQPGTASFIVPAAPRVDGANVTGSVIPAAAANESIPATAEPATQINLEQPPSIGDAKLLPAILSGPVNPMARALKSVDEKAAAPSR